MARILIIEDDENVRSVLAQILAIAGHEVETAPDGTAGLEAVRRSQPDLVIADLFMPRKDGIETVMEIRERYAGIKCIGISGAASPLAISGLAAMEKLGAQMTLQKPFTRQDLVKAVNAVLSLVSPVTGQSGNR